MKGSSRWPTSMKGSLRTTAASAPGLRVSQETQRVRGRPGKCCQYVHVLGLLSHASDWIMRFHEQRVEMIRLLDIPGALQLEARLELLPHLSASSDARTRDLLAAVVDVLGFRVGWGGWVETPDMTPDEELIDLDFYLELELSGEAVDFWARRGWDIAGADGAPVRFFDAIRTAIIVIDEGRAGFNRVAVEAALWKRRRANDSHPDPKRQKQDRSYLAFGGRSRRRYGTAGRLAGD